MQKPVPSYITTGTFIRAIVIGAIACAVWILHSLVLLVLTSIVIASAIEPGIGGLVRRKIPRVLSVLFMYLVVFGLTFAVVFYFLPPILVDFQGILSLLPQYLGALNLPPPFNAVVGGGGESLLQSLFSVQGTFPLSGEGAFALLATIFGGVFSFLIVVVLSFYFALQETGVEDFIRLASPTEHEEYLVSLWHRARNKIGLWMQGQVLSSLIGGVLAYLGLLILGVPYAFLLALFTAAAMLVPIFGSFIAAFPAMMIGFSTEGATLALLVGGLYLIINQFEAHLIHPLVVNKVVGIPPLLVILALIVGAELAGFLGVLLAIPLAATLREFLTDYDKGKRLVS